MKAGPDRTPAPGERLYRALLHLYPRSFRVEYGEAMVDFYGRRLADERRAAGGRARGRLARAIRLVHLLLRLHADLVVHAVAERFAPLPRRSLSPLASSLSPRQPMLTLLKHDTAYALRTLRRSPAFTMTVLVTLALGIGANVAIFSVVNGVLLRPLPFADADRVIQLSNGTAPATLSEPEVADMRRDAKSFSRIGSYAYADGNLTGDRGAERVRLARVDAGFFTTLAPAFTLGRGFAADEDIAGAPDVVVISHGLWQRRFGMDSSVIGQRIMLNDVPRTVIGVTPLHFDYPAIEVGIWTPLRLDRDGRITRNNHYLRVVARLASGATLAAADAEMRAMRDQWARDYPETYRPSDPLRVDVRPIRERIVGAARPYLVALLGAVGFVLLIACANVANLLLVRGEVRRKEMTIRSTLGATRTRLAAQLTLESAVLTVGGGVLGMAAAWPSLRLLLSAAPASIPRLETISLDGSVLLFAAATCVGVGVLFSLAPLAQVARANPVTALNSGARNASAGGGRAGRRTRAALVASEVALAVMMLAGAAVFLRTLSTLRHTQLGFATDHVLTARITLPREAYRGAKATDFVTTLVDRARTFPGVTDAAAMAWTPIVEAGGTWSIVPEGFTSTAIRDLPLAAPQQVTPGFFETLEIPLLAGRTFTPSDREGGDPVAIVSESLARELWGTTDALGHRFRMSADGWPLMTVVGVVGDIRADGLTEPAPPTMYFPHRQAGATAYFTSLSMTLLVHTAGDVSAPVAGIRQAVRDLDPDVPVSDVRTMNEVVASSIARQRFTTLLLSGLAALAMTLAAIGIYGIISYSVAQRRYELGIRLALGAGGRRILALVLGEGLAIALVGLAAGALGVVALDRVLRSLVAGVQGIDLPTMGVVSGVLLVVAALALVIPARRASRFDPTEAMRAG